MESNQEPKDQQNEQQTELQPLNDEEIAALQSEQQPTEEKPKTNWLWNFAKEWVPSILIALALWFLLSSYVIQSVRIPTGSMRETIVEEDRVMILKFLHFDTLERGDIIVFYPPVKGKEDVPYIKRLIGVPGDKVVVKDGALYLNGKKQDEPYVRDSYINYSADFGTVPEGKYLMLGDNRNQSADASTYATQSSGSNNWYTYYVDEDQVIGKALFRFYPLDRFGAIKRLDK